jgi:hypothetical protein
MCTGKEKGRERTGPHTITNKMADKNVAIRQRLRARSGEVGTEWGTMAALEARRASDRSLD